MELRKTEELTGKLPIPPTDAVFAFVGEQRQIHVGAAETQVREEAGFLGERSDPIQKCPQCLVLRELDTPFQAHRTLPLAPWMAPGDAHQK